MSNAGHRHLEGVTWAFQDLFVSNADTLPAYLFKSNRTGHIFVSLGGKTVRGPVNLNNYTLIQEGEIRYNPHTKEWVLGAVRLSEEGYFTLQKNLWFGPVSIKPGPVSEEHPNEFGPVVP